VLPEGEEMDEQEWLAATDPAPMMRFLRGRASDRKLRLFAVACVRRVAHLLVEKRSLEAVELAEQFAEGRASKADLINKRKQLNDGVKGGGTARFLTAARRSARSAGWTELKAGAVSQAWTWAWSASRELLRVDTAQAALETAVPAAIAAANDVLNSLQEDMILEAARADERKVQAVLLRDIFGPRPFRPVTLDPTWLAWNGGTIPKLAQAIYEGRAFDRLPILADALAEAGCTDKDILAHSRAPGPHTRGCWPLDAVLGLG
jgi:hypothetical protein